MVSLVHVFQYNSTSLSSWEWNKGLLSWNTGYIILQSELRLKNLHNSEIHMEKFVKARWLRNTLVPFKRINIVKILVQNKHSRYCLSMRFCQHRNELTSCNFPSLERSMTLSALLYTCILSFITLFATSRVLHHQKIVSIILKQNKSTIQE